MKLYFSFFYIFIFLINVNVFSQSIAVMDPRIVLAQYKKKVDFENDLMEREKKYQYTIYDERMRILKKEKEQLERAIDISLEEKSEIASKHEELDKKYGEMENYLKHLHTEYQGILRRDITIAAIIVGKEKGYDMVIDKEVSFYGGDDITQDVVEFLNSSDKTLLEKSLKKGSNNLELIR
ncbi:OmpH family outer membrane protein [uncultured Ilyobacter sp.]|uniref:OmpH family outer membrane protein n=1 Tax=uncultured Ilyobacter sp. TaxID=544433 RepID=UPI0029C7D990|nr:OmpH family outer membrane protein [uncultured Ilyobacter sp.]